MFDQVLLFAVRSWEGIVFFCIMGSNLIQYSVLGFGDCKLMCFLYLNFNQS